MFRVSSSAPRGALVLAVLAGCARNPQPVSVPVTPAMTPAAPAAGRALPESIRWARTSAEHRALYLEIYRLASDEIAQLAAGHARGSWAVILDADETVLDNSPYQRERALVDSGFTPASWDAWVQRAAAEALPGAPEFTQRVRELGGRVAIVTNRDEPQCPATRDNLQRVRIVADVVLCHPVGAPGSKEPRFQAVEKGTAAPGLPPLQVLMWVGDNIQDFPGQSQDIRFLDDSAYARFGRSFIVLPNPMYGSWERNADR